jgi:hypothetical protein
LNSYPSDRRLISLATAAFGVAFICYAGVLFRLASPRHETVFHWHGSAAALFLPVLVGELLVALGIFALLAVVRHFVWLRRAIWSCLLCLAFFAVIENFFFLTEASPPHWLHRMLPLLCVVLTAAAVVWLKPNVFEHIRGIGHIVLWSAAFAGTLVFMQAAWCGFEARHLNDPPMGAEITNTIPASAVPHGRVIWIVLDELAFRQAFAEHSAGADLPNFDALKAQATIFTNVVSASDHTEVAIPALLTGKSLLDSRSTVDGRMQVQTLDHQWVDFDPGSTAFTDAQSLGYRAAIAGWYMPYCRILGGAFSYCTWNYHVAPAIFFPSEEIAVNLVNPILHPTTRGASLLRLKDFLQLNSATDRILQAKKYDFVYLHMPIPHPEGIYDYRRKTYSLDHSSYVDNLALADLYLGHVRAVLEEQNQWDEATVLLMGDHSWRTLLWKHYMPWSLEDEQANRAGFDPRPAYVLKLPYQQTTASVNSEFQAVRTRSLLKALLRGQFHTPQDVQNWTVTSQPLATH